MGFKDWFKVSVRFGTMSANTRMPIPMPGDRQLPVDVIEMMLTHAATLAGRWQAVFEAGKDRSIRVTGDTLESSQPIDLAEIARTLGLTVLADQIVPAGRATGPATRFTIPDAAPGEIAALVDAVFRAQHAGAEHYTLRAEARALPSPSAQAA